MRSLKQPVSPTGRVAVMGYPPLLPVGLKGFTPDGDSWMTMQLVEPFSPPIHEPAHLRLARWRREVPLYRELYQAVPDRAELETKDWLRLPFITRHEMGLNFPHNFLRDGVELSTLLDRAEVELEHTSGTSGERQPLLLGVGWWGLQEGRALQLNRFVADVLEANPTARRAVLASPSCGGGLCNQGQTTARERTDETVLLLSTSRQPWLWSEAEWDRIVSEILEWKPLFLDTDPVYATALARHCLRRGVRFPSVRFVLSSYEFVSGFHRAAVTRALGVPLFNLYGATETGHLLMEDENGILRASTETAWLEIVQPDPAGIGELVVTTMTNEYMPLIRYRIGDLAMRSRMKSDMAWELHGRVRDSLVSADGTRVTTRQVDECLTSATGILHYQCVQDAAGNVMIRYISGDAVFRPEGLADALAGLQRLLGSPRPISARPAEMLLGEASGKFRLTRRAQD